jgi:hypothetical protein
MPLTRLSCLHLPRMPAAAFVDPRKPLLAVPPPVLLTDPLLVSKHAGLAVVGDLGAAGAASLCVAPCVRCVLCLRSGLN